MSRLKREGNPPSNQLASPVPQAWDPSINDFREITGQNLGGGRFGADGVQWGKTASGLFMPIRVTNDGTQEVQLSGTIRTEALGTGISITAGSTIYTDERVNAEKMVGLCYRVSQHVDKIVATPQFRIPVPGITPWAFGTVVSGDASELVVNPGHSTVTVKMTRVYGTHRRWALKNNDDENLILLSIYEVREV